MDSNSPFLTANADTVYYMAVVDLTKGPMVVEQPLMAVGTINDMWFQWNKCRSPFRLGQGRRLTPLLIQHIGGFLYDAST